MADADNQVEQERQLLADAKAKGPIGRYGIYFRLSGPGWIASAITLGGGSLASSLYLGVLGGYSLLWLQPLAMVMGVIMLSAIGYVTLSSGEKPFRAINEHVSPVLGWGWALAVAAANIIWCMPQHSLANAVLSQNLLPSFLGKDKTLSNWAANTFGDSTATTSWLSVHADELAVSLVILVFCTIITWSYDRGGWGLRLYEVVLKIVVAIIVLCFMGVVIMLTISTEPLDWDAIFRGLVPDFGQFWRPADTFGPFLDKIGPAGSAARDFWEARIIAEQRDVMISAVATAVGINMTLMFPYTMLRKGWTKEFRGLAIFDLSTGMFIPYVLATGFVVIASASQFHGKLPDGFSEVKQADGSVKIVVDEKGVKFGAYKKLITLRDTTLVENEAKSAKQEDRDPQTVVLVTDSERRLAGMLVKRDAMDLSASLAPLTGKPIANIVFGLGVLAMVISTISILMLISGFVFAEMTGFPPGGKMHKAGTLVAGVGGAMWPLLWEGESKFYLAVVTSVFGFMLLPFAYVTFVLLMNSKSLLKDEMPRGARRILWNVLTGVSATVATVGAVYMIWVKAKYLGIAAVALFVLLAGMVAIHRMNERKQRS